MSELIYGGADCYPLLREQVRSCYLASCNVVPTAYCYTAVVPHGLSVSSHGGVTWPGNGVWYWTPWGKVPPQFQHTLSGHVVTETHCSKTLSLLSALMHSELWPAGP